MFIPDYIYNYFKELNIEEEQLTSILTDKNGIIQKCHKGRDNLFITNPVKGASIDDFLPGAVTYIDRKQKTYLPNIQTLPSAYADLYIFGNTGKDSTWFILTDVSNRVIKEKEALIHHNSMKLQDGKTSEKIVNLAFLEIGGLILKHISDDKFKIVSEIPEWFEMISPDDKKYNAISLSNMFPFLDTFFLFFLSEKKNGANYVRSGSWLQQTVNARNEVITLQALGMHYTQTDYIIIIPDELDHSGSRQELIQKARENVLAYEKLEKQEIKLKELLRFKQSFNAIISHDFRSPISAISMSIDMLLQDEDFTGNINEENREILGMIQDQLISLNNYNSKVYAWSQLEKEGLELEKVPVDIKKLFADIAHKFSHKLKNKNITLDINIDDEVNINADKIFLSQAFSNLMENAIKFSFKDGRIELMATQKTLTVKDYGMGMNKEQREKILEGGKNKSRMGTYGEPGSGLGMSIVKKIIESHGFTISVESKENKGTEFFINFQ